MGRRSARVPAPAVRARPPCSRRPVHARNGSGAPRYQRRRGLAPDGIAGTRRSRARGPLGTGGTSWHVVGAGESFFSIAARYHVRPWRLARRNRLSLVSVIVPSQSLALRSALATRRRRRRATREPGRGSRRPRLLVPGLRCRSFARSGARLDGVGLPAGRRLVRRRHRRHAAAPRDLGVRRPVLLGARTPRTYRATSGPECAICAGSSTSSGRSAAGTRRLVPGSSRGARARAVRRHEGFVRVVLALYGSV